MTPDQQWHWDHGQRYAIEGMKVLLLLNGGAAVALMTFLGHLAAKSWHAAMGFAGLSLLCFGIGAFLATVVFAVAYETQLQYGKAAAGNTGSGIWAPRWHLVNRCVAYVSIVAFLIGLAFAWLAITHIGAASH